MMGEYAEFVLSSVVTLIAVGAVYIYLAGLTVDGPFSFDPVAEAVAFALDPSTAIVLMAVGTELYLWGGGSSSGL